jgi:aspartate/methionine/tyrosine aminotransferase
MTEVLALADDECKRLWDGLLLMYTESQGLPQLREEIVKQFYGPGLTTDHVNVLVPQEGIFLSMNSLLTASDHVIAVSPAYQSLTAVAESVGCDLSLWNCVKTSDARLVFDVAELERLVRPNTKLLVVNFPHNPTGFLPSQDEWRAIVAFCEKHDLFLFSDEMYHGLESEPSLQLPPACTLYKKAVSLSGMSKTYGMPGVRLGWIASQDTAFIKKLGALKDYTTICNAGPSEILSLIALRNKDRIAKRSLDIIAVNKVVVGEFMAKHASLFEYAEPIAAPMAFPRLRNHPVAEYAEKLVQTSGILILPGEMYGDETYREHFRLSLGRTNIPEILARWSEAIESEASA